MTPTGFQTSHILGVDTLSGKPLSVPSHSNTLFASGATVCGFWHPCYTGVNAIRSVVRSTAATVSRQNPLEEDPAGSGWAANDMRAC